MINTLKVIIGWLAIIALVVFVVTNTQQAVVRLPFDISISAPLSVILLLTAVLGALGASMFDTLWKWAKGNKR
jgi:uncharacterized integral membrane protein